MKWIRKWFKKQSADELAMEQLRQAEVEYLIALSMEEYYRHQAEYFGGMVERLSVWTGQK